MIWKQKFFNKIIFVTCIHIVAAWLNFDQNSSIGTSAEEGVDQWVYNNVIAVSTYHNYIEKQLL